jgi:hypothetical protein
VWTSLAFRGAEWRAETEDVGPGGCLVRCERLLARGLDVRIVIEKSAISEELAVAGKVAWCDAPRAGIAFDPRPLRSRATNAWFCKLLAADRRLAMAAARSPTELDLDARLFLPTPPRIVDLYPDEAFIVSCAEQGIPVGKLLARSGLSDQRLGQVVFGLIAKRVFTLSAGEAGEAWKWRAALAACGPPQAPAPRAAMPDPRPSWPQAAPPPPTPAPIPTPTPTPTPTLTLFPIHDPAPATPPPAAVPPPAPVPPPPTPRARYEPRTGAAFTARVLRGVGSSERPSAAETELGLAREAEAAGRVAEAIQFMRRALAMAPQDREIAGELARLAFIQPA